LSSDDVLELKHCPKSVTIVGSGAIGIEWARIFNAFGAQVTVVEMADRLLPGADFEVSKRIERFFKTTGINFETSHTGEIPDSELILVAIGREPLPSQGNVIGDAAGEIQLAHYGIRQAFKLVSGLDFDKKLIPSIVYGTPEIAWVGAREQDLEPGTFKKSFVLTSALPKAQCDGQTDGFFKILVQNDTNGGKILGAHIISKEASSLIGQLVIAMQFDIGVNQLKQVCFGHPTYSEGIFECLMQL
jgi:dihydrolipoamide dehydrogenase